MGGIIVDDYDIGISGIKGPAEDEDLIEVCPVCGNHELYYEAGGYTGAVYHCKKCGYVGSFVLEANEEMIETIRKEYEKKTEQE